MFEAVRAAMHGAPAEGKGRISWIADRELAHLVCQREPRGGGAARWAGFIRRPSLVREKKPASQAKQTSSIDLHGPDYVGGVTR